MEHPSESTRCGSSSCEKSTPTPHAAPPPARQARTLRTARERECTQEDTQRYNAENSAEGKVGKHCDTEAHTRARTHSTHPHTPIHTHRSEGENKQRERER